MRTTCSFAVATPLHESAVPHGVLSPRFVELQEIKIQVEHTLAQWLKEYFLSIMQ